MVEFEFKFKGCRETAQVVSLAGSLTISLFGGEITSTCLLGGNDALICSAAVGGKAQVQIFIEGEDLPGKFAWDAGAARPSRDVMELWIEALTSAFDLGEDFGKRFLEFAIR